MDERPCDMTGARLRHAVRLRVEPATEARPLLNLEQIETGTGRVLGDLGISGPFGSIRFEPGDVLFSKLRPYLAKSVRVQSPMHGTGELLAMTPGPSIDSRYLMYVTLSTPWLETASLTAYGTKMPRTSWEAMADFRLPDLQLDHQQRIADFLDDQVARIDNAMAARRLQTELVVAERRSRVHFAVTGGHAARRQPSRLAWADTIPNHWSSVRVCQVARIGTGHTPSRSKPEYWIDADIPWLTTSDVYRFRFDQIDSIEDTEVHISRLGLENSSAVIHPAGTVGLSRTSASAGFAIYMAVPVATSQDFATWTPGPLLDGMFLLWCLRSMHHDLMDRLAMGSTHKTIYFPELMSVRIPLPPLAEQKAIVESIKHSVDSLRRHSAALVRSIGLLEELKRSLITAAVTGEFDVSSADGSRVRV
jgi:type I restriction enzyme S subunit